MFGLELHPAVVHFPIALGVTGALAEIAYLAVRKPWLRWFGPLLLSAALIGAAGAYFSGDAASDRAEDKGIPKAPIEQHEETCVWSIGALALTVILSWATHARGKGVVFPAILALITAGLFLYTGYLGGRLVYIHGAGRVSAAAVREWGH